MFALILNNLVVQVAEERFDVASPLYWVECSSSVVEGSVYSSNGTFYSAHTSTPTLESAKNEVLSAIADYRYSQEIRGIEVDGFSVLTTRESQSLLSSAMVLAKEKKALGEWYAFDLKTSSGWYKITSDQMISVASAVLDHVQRCFSQEKRLADMLGGLTSVEEVLAFDFRSLWKV